MIADRPVGVDIERRFTPQMAAELEDSIISPTENSAAAQRLALPLALTLAFSAKESGFKATPAANQRALGFADFQIVDITASTLALEFAEQRYPLHWIASEEQVITLAHCSSKRPRFTRRAFSPSAPFLHQGNDGGGIKPVVLAHPAAIGGGGVLLRPGSPTAAGQCPPPLPPAPPPPGYPTRR